MTKTTQEYNKILAEFALFQHSEERKGRTDEEIIGDYGGDDYWKIIVDFEDGYLLSKSVDSGITVYTVFNQNNFADSRSAEPLEY